MNITNKLFIVKYVFVDVDICEEIVLRNSSIESDNRENFDDINFETIFAQNIRFFDVAKSVVDNADNVNSIKINKINSIKINKINSMKVNKIMKKVDNEISDEIKNCFENETISLNTNKTSSLENEVNIYFKDFVANFF